MNPLLLLVLAGLSQNSDSLEWIRTLPQGDDVFFGEVSDVDMFSDGSIVVLDNLSHQLVLFGPEGRQVRTVGRQGNGPGELNGALELAITPDDRMVVLDYRNRRFSVWNREGELVESVRLTRALGNDALWPHEFLWSSAGPMLKTSEFIPGKPFHIVKLTDDLSSVADTVLRLIPSDSNTCMFCPWIVGPSGDVRAAAGDTVFAIREFDRTGKVTREWSHVGLPAARRSEAEFNQLRDVFRARAGREGGTATDPSRFKPRLVRESLEIDAAGRLWVVPSVEAESRTNLYVFERPGENPRVVSVNPEISGFQIRGNILLGIGEDADGGPVVHVFEIKTVSR